MRDYTRYCGIISRLSHELHELYVDMLIFTRRRSALISSARKTICAWRERCISTKMGGNSHGEDVQYNHMHIGGIGPEFGMKKQDEIQNIASLTIRVVAGGTNHHASPCFANTGPRRP